jgi:hypothetical protein
LQRALYFLAAVLLADYLYTAWTWIAWNRRPGLDQDVWLMGALAVREGRGLSMGNDHPLYTAILSLWAGRSPSVFTFSKLFSLLVGAATIAATYRIGEILFDRETGLLAAAALGLNWITLSLSMSLRAEVLLPPLFLLHWYCVRRGFSGDGRWWLGGGFFAGLAYLTKGTGTLLVIALFVSAAVAFSKDRSVARKIPWFLAGYLPLAALLWWGNSRLFGDATYNFSVRHAMWLDSWADLPNRTREELTFLGYLSSHGISGMALRLFKGVVSFIPVSLSCLAPSDSHPLAYLLRWPLAAAAGVSLAVRRRRAWDALKRRDGAAWHTAGLFGIFFGLFAWYQQVSSSERFVGPLNPVWMILIASAVLAAFREGRRRFLRDARFKRYLSWVAAAAAGCSALVLGMKVQNWGMLNPFVSDRPPACYRQVHAMIDHGEEPVLFGRSGELTPWYLSAAPPLVTLPESADARDNLSEWLSAKGVRRFVVDWDMADRPFLKEYFTRFPGQEGVRQIRPLPGWERVYRDEYHSPPHVLVYRRL